MRPHQHLAAITLESTQRPIVHNWFCNGCDVPAVNLLFLGLGRSNNEKQCYSKRRLGIYFILSGLSQYLRASTGHLQSYRINPNAVKNLSCAKRDLDFSCCFNNAMRNTNELGATTQQTAISFLISHKSTRSVAAISSIRSRPEMHNVIV